MSEENFQSIRDANPFGKSPEEVERSNRWFRVAVALGKQDDYIQMLETERRQMPVSEQTQHDEHDRRWFNSGWEACRREVLAMAKHQGDTAAVDWASRHPAGRHEPQAEKPVSKKDR